MTYKPTREECAAHLDIFSNPVYLHATRYLREDGARIAALEEQVAVLTETVRCAGETCNSIDASLQEAEAQVAALTAERDAIRDDLRLVEGQAGRLEAQISRMTTGEIIRPRVARGSGDGLSVAQRILASDHLRRCREVGELNVQVAALTSERDASVARAEAAEAGLEWLRECGLFWFTDEDGLMNVARGRVQPGEEWLTNLAAACGHPALARLADKESGRDE